MCGSKLGITLNDFIPPIRDSETDPIKKESLCKTTLSLLPIIGIMMGLFNMYKNGVIAKEAFRKDKNDEPNIREKFESDTARHMSCALISVATTTVIAIGLVALGILTCHVAYIAIPLSVFGLTFIHVKQNPVSMGLQVWRDAAFRRE
ncbi:MAG: hypothetical protein H0X51_08465 [Parachlamydiaceae bacterium]|nr:hypothetical protein [Parachlamydiaceae bacterium]